MLQPGFGGERSGIPPITRGLTLREGPVRSGEWGVALATRIRFKYDYSRSLQQVRIPAGSRQIVAALTDILRSS